jgi:hypothetical protein
VKGLPSLIPCSGSCNSKLLPNSLHSFGLFIFSLALTKQVLYGYTENKNPASGRRSNLSLRREGDSNPRYSYPYGSLANCWFKPLTHLSMGASKIEKHALSAKLFPTYFNPFSMSPTILKFSMVSSSKSEIFITPALTSVRNLENMKFLGISFSLTYSELETVIPSLVFSI